MERNLSLLPAVRRLPMKKVAYLICFAIIGGAIGCAKSAAASVSLEGSWVFKNAGEKSAVERTLVFDKQAYQETSKENGVFTQSDGGEYTLTQSGNAVEIVIGGTNTRVYTGKIAKTGLMIEKINGIELSPPLLYKKG